MNALASLPNLPDIGLRTPQDWILRFYICIYRYRYMNIVPVAIAMITRMTVTDLLFVEDVPVLQTT